MCGKMLKIQVVYPQYYQTIEEGTTRIWNAYRNDPANHSSTKDLYVLATREMRAKFLEEKIREEEEKITEYKVELENLKKYEDDEAEVADKLFTIMQAKDKDSIAKVLRELKQTDYI